MIGSIILLIILAITAFIFTRKSSKNVPGMKKRDKKLGNLADIAEAGKVLNGDFRNVLEQFRI